LTSIRLTIKERSVINVSETPDINALKAAYDGGVEKFKSWLESLPFSQRQQVLKLIDDKLNR